MKFTFIIASLLITTFSQNPVNTLTGKWKGDKQNIEYEFQKDGSIIFGQSNQHLFIHSYKIDSTKSPYYIDFEIKRGATSIIIPGLLQVIHEDTIILEQFAPVGSHPERFTDEPNFTTITLIRQ